MIKRKENPAKIFLRRYIWLVARIEALQQAINQAMDRAFRTGVTLKEIKVQSSPAEHDPMARDVCNAVDACEILYEYREKAQTALRDILAAIESLEDERQKEVLTLRYINGKGFTDICEVMHYEKTQVFVLHGRALVKINEWIMKKEGQKNEWMGK